MNKRFKGNGLKDLVWKCATRTTIREFEESMEELSRYDAAACDWLRSIPPRSWARSHFSGRANCDLLLNNLCESFNSKLVDGRDKPIISCLEFIREYMMKRIVLVQKVQDTSHGTLTPTATKVFENIKKQAGDYIVTWNGGDMYQCNGPWDDQVVVNLRSRTYACRRWELTGMPCKHAVAAIWNMATNGNDIGLLEDWVNPCYRLDTWKAAYAYKIQPTNGMKMWPRSDCPTSLLPPLYHTPIGRPKKKRSRSSSARPLISGSKLTKRGKSISCGKCGGVGHNQRKCKVGESSASVCGQRHSEVGESSEGDTQLHAQSDSQRQSQPTGGRGVRIGQPDTSNSETGVQGAGNRSAGAGHRGAVGRRGAGAGNRGVRGRSQRGVTWKY